MKKKANKEMDVAEVVILDDYRPYYVGFATCKICGYRWTAVCMFNDVDLECPKCEEMSGWYEDS